MRWCLAVCHHFLQNGHREWKPVQFFLCKYLSHNPYTVKSTVCCLLPSPKFLQLVWFIMIMNRKACFIYVNIFCLCMGVHRVTYIAFAKDWGPLLFLYLLHFYCQHADLISFNTGKSFLNENISQNVKYNQNQWNTIEIILLIITSHCHDNHHTWPVSGSQTIQPNVNMSKTGTCKQLSSFCSQPHIFVLTIKCSSLLSDSNIICSCQLCVMYVLLLLKIVFCQQLFSAAHKCMKCTCYLLNLLPFCLQLVQNCAKQCTGMCRSSRFTVDTSRLALKFLTSSKPCSCNLNNWKWPLWCTYIPAPEEA